MFTEHRYLWTDEELSDVRKLAEVESSFIILAGQEVETDIGHVLVYGAERSLADKYGIKELRKNHPKAALVWAHPFRKGKLPSDAALTDKCLDAVEIINNNHTVLENYSGIKKWHDLKFIATSGSDAHAVDTVALYPTIFDHPVYSIDELAAEVRSGRCRPFMKEIPRAGSNLVVNEITFGTKGPDELRGRIITKQYPEDAAWKSQKKTVELRNKINSLGLGTGKYRTPIILSVDDRERMIIEEGQRGKPLLDRLLYSKGPVQEKGVVFAAEWLAKFHELGIAAEEKSDALKNEAKKVKRYLSRFGSAELGAIEKTAETLIGLEKEILSRASHVLCHGDFHPMNIIIGQDRTDDPDTMFVSVIDFDNAFTMPSSFDVGYFLEQLDYQVWSHGGGNTEKLQDIFLETYINASGQDAGTFKRQVRTFRKRACLSIMYFLHKVGKGSSKDFNRTKERFLS